MVRMNSRAGKTGALPAELQAHSGSDTHSKALSGVLLASIYVLGFDRAVTVHDSARFARPCRFASAIDH
jgi:hypothetical protein